MVWNGQPQSGQNSPGQQNSAQQGFSLMPQTSMDQLSGSIPMNGVNGAINANAPLVNPLQSQIQPIRPIGQAVPTQTPQGAQVSAGASLGLPQTMSNGRPVAAAQLSDDDQVPADDVAWINLARRAIAETRGDPHRQVQLLQHIRAQYLKQRYNRTVRTDEA